MKHLVSNNWPITPHYRKEKLKTILNDQDTLESTGYHYIKPELSLYQKAIKAIGSAWDLLSISFL